MPFGAVEPRVLSKLPIPDGALENERRYGAMANGSSHLSISTKRSDRSRPVLAVRVCWRACVRGRSAGLTSGARGRPGAPVTVAPGQGRLSVRLDSGDGRRISQIGQSIDGKSHSAQLERSGNRQPRPPGCKPDRRDADEAVRGALRLRLGDEQLKRGERPWKDAAIDGIIERFNAVPVLNDRTNDEILSYDENGLPS